MSRFTEALVVSPMADGGTWVVVRPFGYEVGAEGSGDIVEVAVGFQTDFASIPRVFWILLPKWGRYGNASVIHDWLYWEQSRSRQAADTIFLEAMGVLEVARPTRRLMHGAVRLFGSLAWARNRADREEGFDRVLGTTSFKAAVRSRRPGTVERFARLSWRRLTGQPTSRS